MGPRGRVKLVCHRFVLMSERRFFPRYEGSLHAPGRHCSAGTQTEVATISSETTSNLLKSQLGACVTAPEDTSVSRPNRCGKSHAHTGDFTHAETGGSAPWRQSSYGQTQTNLLLPIRWLFCRPKK